MKKYLFIISILYCLIAASCKPTEKGYKSAYDAALGKREAMKAELDAGLVPGTLQQVDGAQMKTVNGVEVYVLNQKIKPVENTKTLPGSYNVAVGTYKMITNCESQAYALRQDGYDAFAAKEPDGMYYTVAGSFNDIDEAVKFYQKFMEGKDRVYVGLPSAPVIIYSGK